MTWGRVSPVQPKRALAGRQGWRGLTRLRGAGIGALSNGHTPNAAGLDGAWWPVSYRKARAGGAGDGKGGAVAVAR